MSTFITRHQRTRIFISFDYDKDLGVAKLLGGQLASSRSPFEVENWSMKEAAPVKTWGEEARRRINRSDVVLVVVGAQTHRAAGVLEEVRMARELGVPLRQVIGYSDLTSPTPVLHGGRLYRWTWDNLITALDVARRRAA
ncbi:MAG: TIR domain-containing protein [Actinomycetota bacterium]